VVNENDRNTELERRSKALFDESVEGLSGNIRSKLTQARHAALAEAGTHRSSRRVWLPAAGLATAAAITAFVVVPQLRQERAMPESVASADDMAILLNSDDLELLEDIEFYAWLDSDGDAQPTGSDSDARS
jgi:hypothetical protein